MDKLDDDARDDAVGDDEDASNNNGNEDDVMTARAGSLIGQQQDLAISSEYLLKFDLKRWNDMSHSVQTDRLFIP